MHNGKAVKVEVHAHESWLSTDWEREHLPHLEIVEPTFHPDTDAFLFYEKAVVDPALYSRAPLEKRFGLLTEASVARPFAAQSLSHVEQFRVIYTHDPLLLALHSTYRRNLFGTSWAFRPQDVEFAPTKSQTISMITSNLSRLPGHRLRLAICSKLHEQQCGVDIYGRDIPWGPFIASRRDAVAPYLFTIAIENCQRQNYFTEKLVDPLVTRTVPIYWGCPNIAEFLNPEGIILIANERDFWRTLEKVLSDPARIYESKRQALEENAMLAIDRYNVRHAWGGVAEKIANDLQRPWSRSRLSRAKRLQFRLIQQAFLLKEHGWGVSMVRFAARLKNTIRRA